MLVQGCWGARGDPGGWVGGWVVAVGGGSGLGVGMDWVGLGLGGWGS